MINLSKLLMLSILILFIGCGSKSSNITTATSNYPIQAIPAPTIYSDPYSTRAVPLKRIITKRANIRVEVDKIEEAKEALTTLLEKSGGHIINARLYEDRYNASAKVPSDKLIMTLDEIAKLGDKISQSISQNDVTNQFVDHEARLKNLILFRDKMQNLLSQTTKIEEILKIERELGRVQTQIDAIQGRLKYLKDAVVLSPIEINFEEKTIYGPLGYIANGIWWVTKKLFVIR
ncbi:DUF4349 domain-containing protein [Sulfurovum sp. bin170]|uniref:DUF4349 domain-containing protein n=1 Tax=Sulfurovum sp. bin170 TaxID=2695268 RepID=UPI0013E078B4|nr:DUF4349 domain-containing protein [Sulfurovum sp. bin170]NEW61644.1 DUF4349 domain-containing protein [Sulfurovum sp. bin170]